MKKNSIFYVINAIYCIFLFFCFKNDPFFGDGISTVSRLALIVYNSDFTNLWYPPDFDPGHPTLFPILIALCWKLVGFHLWVGHAVTAICGFITLSSLYFIGILWHKNHYSALLTTCLWAVSPFFVAQMSQVLTHLPLTALFLGTLYFALKNKILPFIITSIIMVWVHLQATFLLLALFLGLCALAYVKEGRVFNPVLFRQFMRLGLMFLPSAMAFGVWIFLHYQACGWWISAPAYASHRSVAMPSQFLYNLGIIVWRIIDYGYIIIYILGLIAYFKINKKNKCDINNLNNYHNQWVLWATITIALSSFIALFLTNSIAHRYFLPISGLGVCIAGGYIINAYQNSIYKWWLALVVVAGVLAGNFFYYPFKCIGDANIVFRFYPAIEKQISLDFPDVTFGTYAPLSNSQEARYMDKSQFALSSQRLYDKPLSAYSHILVSNLTCEFSPSQKDSLNTYYRVKKYESHWNLLGFRISKGIWAKVYYK